MDFSSERLTLHFIKDFWNKNEWTDSFVYGMLHSDLEGAR
ncbi:acetyltransferase [Alkalihalophilus pseudofirmus OF4]|uniref:Acetyltransferase n=1 Tax=Alkalihalophilus pseudofirmus (strain ATCC BAA-2126 / JCM 17055 / OF4) TaxID=398511 RepID=D3FRB6_ALKPO|nr:acetyltransferase [Alkalihalophilus pseudofirmus OF4]